MADFTVTIFVESFFAPDAAPAQSGWLGRTLTMALTGTPAREITAAEKEKLVELLSPWRWERMEWSAPIGARECESLEQPELETYLGRLLDDGAFDLLRFRSPNAVPDEEEAKDDHEEGRPLWPGLLLQLSRTGAPFSRALNLAHADAVSGAFADPPRIQTITVGEVLPLDGSDRELTLPDGNKLSVAFHCHAETCGRLPAGGTTGLIEHDTRLVRRGKDDEERREVTATWLAELPSRLGRAIDPLMRLADLWEAGGQTQAPASAEVEVLLRALLGGTADETSAMVEPILLAVANTTPLDAGETPDARKAFAESWSRAFAGQTGTLAKALIAELPLEDKWTDAAAFRRAYAAPDFREAVRQALLQSIPTGQAPGRLAAERWLGEDGNVDLFFWSLLPEALARRTLLPKLIASAGGKSADRDALKTNFDALYDQALADFGLTPRPDATAAAKAEVFHIERASVDAAARDGVPFRLDTVFLDAPQGGPDPHLILDGALVAVAAGEPGGAWETYRLATAGNVAVVLEPKPGQSGQGGTSHQNVPVPLQVPFDLTHNAGTTESRVAAASYVGEAMIPRSDRPMPQTKGKGLGGWIEEVPIGLVYTPSAADLPPLAYGRHYRIVCGYQAPGGLLPAYFSEGKPWDFSANALQACPEAYVLEVPLRRSLLPGAPRLLGPDGGALASAGPRDKEVRPLWREHVGRWGAAEEAARRQLGDVTTLYLDPLAGDQKHFTVAPDRFAFTVRPPALGLGTPGEGATTALVWRYWRERDRQWEGGEAVSVPANDTEADDPAVVGRVKGQPGRGGVHFALHEILPAGLVRNARAVAVAVLAEGQSVQVVVRATQNSLDMACTPADVHGIATLTIEVPQGRRFLFEASTLCDGRFMDGGEDARFAKDLTGARKLDGDWLFGTSRLAIEVLPEADHLPPADALRRLLRVKLVEETGAISAIFADPQDAVLAEQADYIGELEPVWQTWKWDGGPVVSYESADGGKLEGNQLEPDAARRDPQFEGFERIMFENRRDGGTMAVVRRTARAEAKLFELESLPNRGADYLRVRLTARSRYAALRPDRALAERAAGVPSSLLSQATVPWRGFTIGLRRRDPLPTPRIGLAAPLFGRVEDGASTAGGIALYIDHAMFDTRSGGGLAEQLEVALCIERVPHGFDKPDAEETAALAVGADPIRHDGGDPFAPGAKPPPRLWYREGETWSDKDGNTFEAPPTQLLKAGTILGQTLEPQSPEPQFPFAIAFVEPVMEGALLRPDTMAMIRARTRAGAFLSDWSAPFWVHFLPDMSGSGPGKGGAQAWFRAEAKGDHVLLDAKAGVPEAAVRMERLVAASEETFEAAKAGAPYLASRVLAVYVGTVAGAAGEPRLRPFEIVAGIAAGGGLRFELPKDDRTSHLRLIEVQRVTTGAPVPTRMSLPEATGLWFGERTRPHPAGGRHGSRDIQHRVTGVGPLIPISGRPPKP